MAGSDAERAPQAGSDDAAFQNQLETYSEWIAAQSAGDWPGGVVLLDAWHASTRGITRMTGREGLGSYRFHALTWKGIAGWLADNLDLNKPEITHCALVADFTNFLGGRD